MNNRSIAFESPKQIKIFQEEALREQLAYNIEHSPYYQKLFAEHKLSLNDINSLEDLSKIPPTTKTDLQKYNKDFICVQSSQIRDYVTTSGTLGEPVTFALTENDLERLAYNEESSFLMANCQAGDCIQLMTTIDRRFMAGLAYFLGARRLGCPIIRVGNGIPELQWQSILNMRPTVCIVVPSFILKLIDFARKNNINYHQSSLRKAICIGEALYNADGSLATLGKKIRQEWPELELYSTYASTEMQSSYTECSAHNGCHIPSDLIITEYLDEQNQAVASGEAGELTITTLGIEGMPLIRFKTGDICIHYDEPCACGRKSPRLSAIIGRKKQMIKFKGTTLYPPAIFDILDNIPEIDLYIVEVSTNEIGTDNVLVRVASSQDPTYVDKTIKNVFRSRVRVAPNVVFSSFEEIERLQQKANSRKLVKFLDLR